MDFAHQIRNALEGQRLTQRDLAERLGVTEGAVSQYLRGNLTETTIDRIGAAIGVTFLLSVISPTESANEGSTDG